LKEKQNHPTPSPKAIGKLFDLDKKKKLEIKDDVNHPDHYTMGIEVTDFVASWEMDWFRGNILKYVVRCPFKNNPLKDLKKAKWYLDDLIERVEDGKYIL